MSGGHKISIVASARAILTVPNEIACQILDDVPLYRILQMAASLTEPSQFRDFTSVLLSLPRTGGSFFPSDEHTLHMIELYRKYYALSLDCRKLNPPAKSPLAMSFNSSRQLDDEHLRLRRNSQADWLVHEIYRMLNDLQWTDGTDEPDCGKHYPRYHMRKHWEGRTPEFHKYYEAVKEQNIRFTTARAQQIQIMKQLYSDYPSLLKKASDPDKGARPNHEHIEASIDACVRKYVRDQKGERPYRRGCYLYRQPYYPLVPLDSLLEEFTNFVQKQLPSTGSSSLHSQFQNLSLTESSSKVNIPASIQKHIATVLEGLPYVYTSPTNPKLSSQPLLRTCNTPWSINPTDLLPYQISSHIAASPNDPEGAPSIIPSPGPSGDSDPRPKTTTKSAVPAPSGPSNAKSNPDKPGSHTSLRFLRKDDHISRIASAPWANPSAYPSIGNDSTTSAAPSSTPPVFFAPPYRHLVELDWDARPQETKIEKTGFVYLAGEGRGSWERDSFPVQEEEFLRAFCEVVSFIRGLEVGEREKEGREVR